MKLKSAARNSFSLRLLLISTSVMIAFGSFTPCNAQSITGKWKRTFTKIFVTDKATGKQVPASAEMQKTFDDHANAYHETLELKSDNTYISTISTSADEPPKVHNGVYTLSGNDLDMKIPLVRNEKTTITIQSVNATTMIWELVFMGKKTEIVYSKL
ncbi:MAG: hypothetical protein M3Z92_07550 [Bacteroidota bacterium]|nr:hypothetical protein [Bacteroidota bacterium]